MKSLQSPFQPPTQSGHGTIPRGRMRIPLSQSGPANIGLLSLQFAGDTRNTHNLVLNELARMDSVLKNLEMVPNILNYQDWRLQQIEMRLTHLEHGMGQSTMHANGFYHFQRGHSQTGEAQKPTSSMRVPPYTNEYRHQPPPPRFGPSQAEVITHNIPKRSQYKRLKPLSGSAFSNQRPAHTVVQPSDAKRFTGISQSSMPPHNGPESYNDGQHNVFRLAQVCEQQQRLSGGNKRSTDH
ncbi:hypothetical protein M501DRAFT_1035492 [Patellaria atrata CBS 101060]|uniref:Uncharacterized protein n=1 Tax=Patellaria atrata CBS 101060 TaxID=1346257 RepID=A0A9P4S2P7_9PEZI|nr:hypothetical protein M501DRAFT_1035492 [Patellaria atrata CBS 101060]